MEDLSVLAGLGQVRSGYMSDAARPVYIKWFAREAVGRGVVISGRGKKMTKREGKEDEEDEKMRG